MDTVKSLNDEVEHIAAVQDNPFVRNFGIDNAVQHRVEVRDIDGTKDKSNGRQDGTNEETEQEQEYHVNSGFVNKLRSKFAELESKNQKVISLSRRSASVENLLSLGSHAREGSGERSRFGSASRSSADDTKVELRKKHMTSASSNRLSFEKPKKSELKTNYDKPPFIKPALAPKGKSLDFSRPNNVIRSVKAPVGRRSSTEAVKQQRNSASSPTKIEHHDWKVAPDLEKIATDNIVIIESTTPSSPRESKLEQIPVDEKSDFRHVRPFRKKSLEENKKENELPKPNTVSTFLSMFEKGKRPVRPVQAWRKNLSPTRKNSGSDTSSPRTSSPGVTPRSPLTKALDDNVFTDAQEKSEVSNENLLPKDTKDISEVVIKDSNTIALQNDRDFSDSKAVQNDTKIDTDFLHSKIKPNLERTKSIDEENEENFEISQSSVSDQVTDGIQSSKIPTTPLCMIFDSTSVAPKKKTLKIRTEKHHKVHKVPKDTLALKHEKDHEKTKSPEVEDKGVILSPKEKKKTDFIEKNMISIDNNENVSNESNVKPSQRKAKISPRKTKIFDSSNMVKSNRDPPKIPSKNMSNATRESRTNEKPKQISVKIKDNENRNEGLISKPPRLSQNLKKETKTGLDKSTDGTVGNLQNSINIPKGYDFQKASARDLSNSVSEPESITLKPVTSTEEQPVTGVSSFVASRLKKSQEQSNGQQLKTSSMHLLNGSAPSPVPRKRPAPEIPQNLVPSDVMDDEKNKSTPPPLPSTPEPELPKTNIDDIISRRNKTTKPMPKMVFDSSKIANKRKEPPKRKPPRKTLEEINKIHTNGVVPKLDLTSITDDTNETDYQEGYIPTVIQPCPFKFIGGEVIPEKSPYKKTNKVKQLKISFDDHATTTFEYAGEEAALESYLQEHPEEREEALKQEEEINSIMEEVNNVDPTKDSPRRSEQDALKSNTVIGQPTGALINYKSKMQIDFQFGVPTESSDDDVSFEPEPELVDPDSLQLLPADENELETFSAEVNKADMLF